MSQKFKVLYLIIMLHNKWKNKMATSRFSNCKSVCTLIHPIDFFYNHTRLMLPFPVLQCYKNMIFPYTLLLYWYCHEVQWFNMHSTTSLSHCISSNYAPAVLNFMDVDEAQTSLLECINYKRPLSINNCSC